jgi:hypothetical protein
MMRSQWQHQDIVLEELVSSTIDIEIDANLFAIKVGIEFRVLSIITYSMSFLYCELTFFIGVVFLVSDSSLDYLIAA